MYCSSPIRFMQPTTLFPTIPLCSSSSPPPHSTPPPSLPSSSFPLPIPIPIPTISEFLVSKYISFYLVTRLDMPHQCIFWKPVENIERQSFPFKLISPIPNLISGEDALQRTASVDPDSSLPR